MNYKEAFSKIQTALIEFFVEHRREYSDENSPECTKEEQERLKEHYERDFQDIRDCKTLGNLISFMDDRDFEPGDAADTILRALIDGEIPEGELSY